MWYKYTMEYYSAIKKNKIMPFTAAWMGRETLIISKVRKRKTNIIWYHFHLESNIPHNERFHRKETHGLGEQTCGCQGGGSWMDWEFGVNRCKLLHLE